MVKHSPCLGWVFFMRERFGRPQFLAAGLLLAFLAQCAWLEMRPGEMRQEEAFRIQEGLGQWHGILESQPAVAGTPFGASAKFEIPADAARDGDWDPHHSPLWYLTNSAPLLSWQSPLTKSTVAYWRFLGRVASLMFGLVLGASVWYVSRRLYGNAGGYIALTLYCFSPGIIRGSAVWFAEPEMGAAWAAFGVVFTAIAVAHTLYAPREVVLWNWRRILLLGLSLALAIGSQFSLLVLVPLALGFMLYLAPMRRMAATVIWVAACVAGFLLLYGSYFFRTSIFWQGLRHASFFGIAWQAFGMRSAYEEIVHQLGQNSPALLVALPAALVAYVVWPRARYFGNTAPLLVAALFTFLALATPHYPGMGFHLMVVPFLFVFVAGVAADLLETPQRNLAQACVWGLLIAQAVWNVAELARVRG
jgi:hypothetical protein